ncbi:MAG: class I SAM-dependent methyltransferase [Spirochaetes bacterium]|nr:MAG: class I SAM-dependent methyltransferase [Spirochaetota bacterium]
MLVKNDDFYREYVRVWDEGAMIDAPFITLGVEAILKDFYGDLLDAPPPFPVEAGERVLDLGCGWGRVLKPVMDREARATGLDISTKMAGLAKAHLVKNGHLPAVLVGDGTATPFRDGSFDKVYSLLVLQHLSKENGRAVFREAHRVLRDGGTAYIRVPGRFAPENLLFAFLQFVSIHVFRLKDPIRMRFYTLGEINKICREHFRETTVTAHEFRPPWNFHTRWTWHYIIVPRAFHARLRSISDWFEQKANTRFPFLRHFGVVLMVKAVK